MAEEQSTEQSATPESNSGDPAANSSEDLSLEQMYASFQPNNDQASEQQQSSEPNSQQQSAPTNGEGILNMMKQVMDKVDNLQKTHEDQAREAQMNEVLDKVNAHAGLNDKDLLRAIIEVKAEKDQGLSNVFKNMDQNPAMFDKAMEALGKDISKSIKDLPNQDLTEQINAMDKAHENFTGPEANKSALDEKLSNITNGDDLLNELRKVASNG